MAYTRGQLEELQAGVYVPEPVTVTFDGTGNNGKIAAAATLTTALTGSNNDLTFTAKSNGIAGNDITIEYSTSRKVAGSDIEVEVSGKAIVVNLKTSAGVKATATLTSSGVFSDTETVTIGDVTYTFKTALSTGPTVPYEVLIGASAAASLDNLKSAVNGTAGAGTTYSTGTEAHPDVEATTNADDSQLFVAREIGAAGNLIATTSTAADNAFGALTMEGGEDVNQPLSTAAEVDSAIDGHTAAAALVTPANAGGNNGTGVVTVMAATNLTGGSDGYVELFTVEEDGIIAVTAKCTEDLVGNSATLQVGISGNTAGLIPLTTATEIDANKRMDRNGLLDTATPSNATPFLPVLAGQTVIATVLSANITDGTIEYTMQHRPFSGRSALMTSDGYFLAKAAPTAFAGGTSNARGDDGGTSDPLTLFNVTGVVACKVIGFCTVDLVSAGGGTLSVGTALSAAGLIAQTTATAIDANEIWHDNSPDASVELSSVASEKIVFQNIIETVGTADITAGQIYYLCLWRPLSPDGFVRAA